MLHHPEELGKSLFHGPLNNEGQYLLNQVSNFDILRWINLISFQQFTLKNWTVKKIRISHYKKFK